MNLVNSRPLRLILLLASVIGCNAPRGPFVVTNPDPASKIPAIKQVVRAKDLSAARQLVKDLDSDDGAVRFYAINGLERLTGETFGYRYFDDEDERKPALEKWQHWLGAQEQAHARPATNESSGSAADAK
jgi:hypothetical protein